MSRVIFAATKRSLWGLLGCPLVVVILLLQGCGGSNAGSDFTFIADTSHVRGVWLSRRLDAIWLRKTGSGEWKVGEMEAADAGQVHLLLEILSSLRLGVALSQEGSDSLCQGLSGDGLQICLEYDNRKNSLYTLFLPQGKNPRVYSESLKQGWTIDILGFDEAFITNLSLRRDDWRTFKLGVQRPSELRAIKLVWRDNPENSFAMQVGDGYATRIVSLADSSVALQCDTARVSVFLHSLTSLRSYALTPFEIKIVSPQLDSASFNCKLTLLLQSGDTLSYAIMLSLPIDGEDSCARNLKNAGFLLTDKGDIRRLVPSDWDVTLLPLSDLLLQRQ